jgi:hypothetical protein
MSNQPAYARHSCILTMPLIAFIALAQDTFPKLHIEGEFLPYSASAPTQSIDVVRSGAEFVPFGQRLRIERSADAGEHGFLWTWLPPLHPELCSHPYWQQHCSESAFSRSTETVSVPVRVTTLAAEGTPLTTSDKDFSIYWKLAVVGLQRGETVFHIQAENGGPEVWAYATDDGYLALTPRILPHWDRSLSWRFEPKLGREIQVLSKVAPSSSSK